jgi:hypothetical protein
MAIPPWYPSPRQRPQHHAGITAEAVADLGQRPAGGVESHRRLHLVRTQALSPRRDTGPAEMLGHRLAADAPALRKDPHVVAGLVLLNYLRRLG